MDDDIVDFSKENESLKKKIDSRDEKWLKESKAKRLKQFDDQKRVNLNTSKTKNQVKNSINWHKKIMIIFREVTFFLMFLQ